MHIFLVQVFWVTKGPPFSLNLSPSPITFPPFTTTWQDDICPYARAAWALGRPHELIRIRA